MPVNDCVRIVEVPHTDVDIRVFAQFDSGKPVGAIAIDVVADQVVFLGVIKGLRRRGIATALLCAARDETGLALDMDYGERSADGDAWARVVGLMRGPVHTRLRRAEMEAQTDEWLAALRDRRSA